MSSAKKAKTTHRAFLDELYEEKFNVKKLMYLLENAPQLALDLSTTAVQELVTSLKNLLDSLRIQKEDFPYGYLSQRYWREADTDFGRVYPEKTGYCSLSKKIRHTLSDDLYFDFDIQNCHPTLYLYLVRKYKIENASFLAEYVENVQRSLEDTQRLNNCSRSAAKEWFLVGISGGDPHGLDMTPLMEEFYTRFSGLRAQLYVELKKDDRYKDVPDKSVASFMSFVLMDYEDQIREYMELWFTGHSYTWAVNCFDGGMVLKEDREEFTQLEELTSYVSEKIGIPITITVKSLTEHVIPIGASALESYTYDFFVAFCGRESQVYETRRAYFELTNFFCVSKVKYYCEYIDSSYCYSHNDFKAKNEHLWITEESPKGDKRVSFIKKWLGDENKRRYQIVGLYPPGSVIPTNPIDASDQQYCYSMWKGFKVQQIPSLGNSEQEAVMLLRSLTQYLWHPEASYVGYIERYLKSILMYPGRKTGVCVALKAISGGEGKNTWFEIQRNMFGAEHCTTICNHERDWFGSFNEVIAEKIFIHLEEMSKDTIRKYTKQFLSYITGLTDLINVKGGSKSIRPSFSNYFMTFNNAGIEALPGIQRRLFAHEFDKTQEPRPPLYYQNIYEAMGNTQVMRQYYDYIMSLDMDEFEISKFPTTPYMIKLFGHKDDAVVQNLTRVEQFLVDKITVLFNDSFETEVRFKGSDWYEELKTGCPSQFVTRMPNFYREVSTILGESVTKYMRQGCQWFKVNLDEAIRVFEAKNWKHRRDFMNEEFHNNLTYTIQVPCWKSCVERRTRNSLTLKMSTLTSAVTYWNQFAHLNPEATQFEHTCECGGVFCISK